MPMLIFVTAVAMVSCGRYGTRFTIWIWFMKTLKKLLLNAKPFATKRIGICDIVGAAYRDKIDVIWE